VYRREYKEIHFQVKKHAVFSMNGHDVWCMMGHGIVVWLMIHVGKKPSSAVEINIIFCTYQIYIF
jgi:hypothetical protein